MKSLPTLKFLKEDTRGVSTVVGFIFVFAILMILLSINQAQFVPQENSQVEFQHFQDVRNDMARVHAAISEAGQADVAQYPTVTLGTTYPPRLFAVNPPPPSGTLESSQPYNISIKNQTGAEPENVSTRFLEYQNGYNEMDIGSIWYENSVLYLDERANGGGVAVYENQGIIRNNSKARITALQEEFQESGTGEVTLNIYPAESADVDLSQMSGDVSIEIPTRLSADYWEDEFDSIKSSDDWEYVDTTYAETTSDGDIYRLELTVNVSKLNFNTVGVDSSPEAKGSASQGAGPGGSDEGNGNEDGGNGDAASQVDYVAGSGTAATWGESRVDFEITNNGESDVEITDINIDSPAGNLVSLRESAGGSNTPGQHEIFIDSSTPAIYEASGDISDGADPGVNAYTLGDKVSLTQNGILSSGETAQATLVYFRNNGGQTVSAAEKEIVVTIYFADGSEFSFDFIPPGY